MVAAVIAEARRQGVDVARANGGLLWYAEAILAGRSGERASADDLAAAADAAMARLPVWRDVGRLLAAGPALDDGWGQPAIWLAEAGPRLADHGLHALARRCAELSERPEPSRWQRLGITAREADVLTLVASGLQNKDIAARLFLSPRTVEKHVESLLRKTGSRTRTELVAVAGPPGT